MPKSCGIWVQLHSTSNLVTVFVKGIYSSWLLHIFIRCSTIRRKLSRFNILISQNDKMHQHPRPSPMTASPASSPRTNPTRTNNPREEGLSPHLRSGPDTPGYSEADEGSGDSGVMPSNGPSKDAVKKLDQIIQVSLCSHHEWPLFFGIADQTPTRTSIPKLLYSFCSPACHYPS
jgi:hypothetical protein